MRRRRPRSGSWSAAAALRRASSDRKITSCTSVDLPDPETPVTATIMPSGIFHVDILQVVRARAQNAQHAPGVDGAPARAGAETRSSPRR